MLPSADQLFKDADFIFNRIWHLPTLPGWLNDHGVGVLDWPANSPDLNPIDNLWGIVKRRMRNKRPKNPDELKATVMVSVLCTHKSHTKTKIRRKKVFNQTPDGKFSTQTG